VPAVPPREIQDQRSQCLQVLELDVGDVRVADIREVGP
jgi:hypothetical protein